ncbi:hypothetical protein [Idiomarina seosinensis]|uniref:hypothetical protein n=1 Tax=Idiomarina seosinensis TaxID=281739 RepID=UPI000F87FD26|nr:hypothetical protein [Idiomarina seosinensis]
MYKEVFSEAADSTEQVSSHVQQLKSTSYGNLLNILNNRASNADAKEKMAARASAEEQFLCRVKRFALLYLATGPRYML